MTTPTPPVPVSSSVNGNGSTLFPFMGEVFTGQHGWLSIGIYDRSTGRMRIEFIRYPEDLGHVERIIQRLADTHDLYYCPHLFREPTKREKANVRDTVGCAWADLDTCHPNKLQIPPSIVTETSRGRYQALWLFDSPQPQEVAQSISHRIAKKYEDKGCDMSGWDLTQLLRIPGTANHKYPSKPIVRILSRDSCGVWGEQ